MPLWNGFRRRVSLQQQLSLYLVDEDYTRTRRGRASRELTRDAGADIDHEQLMRMGLMHSASADESGNHNVSVNVVDPVYDPNEPVPLYELLQEHHRGSSVAVDDALRPNGEPTTPNECLTPSEQNYQYLDPPSVALVASNSSVRPALLHQNSRFFDRRRASLREQSREPKPKKRSLMNLGLKFLNAKQHFLLAVCRDVSLIPCLMGLCESWWIVFFSGEKLSTSRAAITTARGSEHFLEGIWCIVAGYLLYSVLDGLMVRWIVTYSTTGAIVRMLSMSTILVAIEQYLVSAFSAEGYQYGLHTWILISCALTLLYIVQNFVTLNVDLKGKRRARFFDFYNIVVFAVVPVGLASFITMIGLLRSLLILRLDLEEHGRR